MKILIVTQYFWPENFMINDLATGLSEKGHQITVLTGMPNYPEGKFYRGYSFTKPANETWKNIMIKRVPLIPRGRNKRINLILNYASFVVFGVLLARHRLKNIKFDLIFVFEISPLTVVLPAIWLKRKSKVQIYLWILDLWPETLYALGVIKKHFWKKRIEGIVRYIYKNCDYFLVASNSFESSLIKIGVNKTLIHFFPNWAENIFLNFKGDPGLENKLPPEILTTGKFKIMFAGNIGEAQDIDSIINAAIITKDSNNILWLFAGDGRSKAHLEELIATNGLSESVILLGKHPVESMPLFFTKADAMLVSLKNDEVFSQTIPAKIQSYMASKKPILTMLSGEGSRIIRESDCGLVSDSGDFVTLAKNAIIMSRFPREKLENLGTNGFDYYMEHFSKDKTIKMLEDLFSASA